MLFLTPVCLTAQPFKSDATGYVADRKFHKLIKDRGYQLVGKFDTVQMNPVELRAPVKFKNNWIVINQYGKVVSRRVMKKRPT